MSAVAGRSDVSAHLIRWLVAAATVGSLIGTPGPVAAFDAASTAAVVEGDAPAAHAVVGRAEPADGGGDDGPGAAPIVGGLVILGAVFAMGLSAIRRQRAEGRRSKLPPIG